MVDWRTLKSKRHVLATGLDGTLIPLNDDEQNRADLQTLSSGLKRNDVTLTFVTGRHFSSVAQAIAQYSLPQPDWIICNVGTSIFQWRPTGDFALIDAYQRHLAALIATMPISRLKERLASVEGFPLMAVASTTHSRPELLDGKCANTVHRFGSVIGLQLSCRRLPSRRHPDVPETVCRTLVAGGPHVLRKKRSEPTRERSVFLATSL